MSQSEIDRLAKQIQDNVHKDRGEQKAFFLKWMDKATGNLIALNMDSCIKQMPEDGLRVIFFKIKAEMERRHGTGAKAS